MDSSHLCKNGNPSREQAHRRITADGKARTFEVEGDEDTELSSPHYHVRASRRS